MKKVPAIRIVRSRMLNACVSPLVSAGLILTFIFGCMCGPYCGGISAEASPPETSCCAAPPLEDVAQTSSCCTGEPGEPCSDTDSSEHVLLDSTSEIHLAVPSAVLFIADRIESEPVTVHQRVAEIGFAEYSPPCYLRFQSFLI